MIDIDFYVCGITGRPFPEVEAELKADGFERVRAVPVRPTKRNRVTLRKGNHENADTVMIEHAWEVDQYGIGRPGKITAAKVLENGARFDYGDGII